MRGERTIQDVDFQASGSKQVLIQGDKLLRAIKIRLQGVLTVTVNGSANPPDQPERLLTRITVRNGTSPILEVSGRALRVLNNYLYGTEVPRLAVSGFTAAGSPYAFNSLLKLPSELLRAADPRLTLLDEQEFPNLNVELTFGTVADLITGGTATVVATATVSAEEESIDREAYDAEDFLFPLKKIFFDEVDIPAVGEYSHRLKTGDRYNRITFIHTDADARADLAVTDTMKVILDGSEYLLDSKWGVFQEGDKQDYSRETLMSGVANLDLDPAGDGSGLIDTSGANRSLEVKFQVTGAPTPPSKMYIVSEAISVE